MQQAQFAVHADIEERHWWFTARRRIMRAVLTAALPPSREKLVIDIGCGTGANIAALSGDYSCIGIDPSRDGIAFARQRFPNVRFIEGNAPEDLGEHAAKADAFLLMDVLEHIEDDKGFLRRLVEAMRPGCLLFMTVPADMSLWTQHDVSFGHFRRYDRMSLQAVWRELPVKVRMLSYFNTRLYPAVKAVRTFNRMTGKTQGAAGTDFAMPHPLINRTLEKFFGSEIPRLSKALDGNAFGFRRGVSLITILEKTA